MISKEEERARKGKGIRWITSIDKDSVELVKVFLNAGIQIRHLKNLTPMNFAVDDRYFYATIDKMENGELMKSLLTSNEPAYIRHYNSIFEELWKNGVDAIERIKDIEAGVDLADIEVIPSSEKNAGSIFGYCQVSLRGNIMDISYYQCIYSSREDRSRYN